MPDAVAETTPCIQAQNALMAGDFQNETQTFIQSACTECKRRKQKCLRHWPCQHCGTRRVGNQCIFRTVLDVPSIDERKAQIDDFVSRMKGKCCFSHPVDGEEADDNGDSTEKDLEQFGYAPSMTSELQTAFQVLPSRQCLDQAPPALELSNRLHGATCELQRAISLDALHLYTVQQLLHPFFWLKSRSCYAGCWGALKSAFVVSRGLNKLSAVAGGIEKRIDSDGSSGVNYSKISNYLKEIGANEPESSRPAGTAIISCPILSSITGFQVELPNLRLGEQSGETGRSSLLSVVLQCMRVNRLLEKYSPPPSSDKTMETKHPFKAHKPDNRKRHRVFDEPASKKDDYLPSFTPDNMSDNISWRDASSMPI